MTTLSQILEHKIVAIIRGPGPEDALEIANALYEGGIRLVEITLNSPDALVSIRKLQLRFGDQMQIGAGTVLTAKEAEAAIDAGATFIISPTLDSKIIQCTKALGAVSIPGAFSPTEVYQAFTAGGDVIKLFPATLGVSYFKSIRGPLPQIPLMPTGGVDLGNIAGFHQAGAVAFGIGSALVEGKKTVTPAYLEHLRFTASQFVKTIHTVDHG